MYWFVVAVLGLLIISLGLNAAYLFRFAWTKGSRARSIIQNLVLLFCSICATLLVIEIFFAFYAQSDGFVFTLASKNWYKRYWRLNSLGFRDKEWTPEMLEGRTRVMVWGDSFVAGAGIENEADRFSNRLGQMLGEQYAVINLGLNGADTGDEIQKALTYPYQPNIVILSFYLNDIEGTAEKLGFAPFRRGIDVPPELQSWVNQSYAFNFFYWRVYRLGPQQMSQQYWQWLLRAYQDPRVWSTYQSLLLEVYRGVTAGHARLMVVVFPNLLAIEESRPMTSQVVALYQSQGVPVLDVAELVRGMDPQDLVVNAVDQHPNEFVHGLVAEKLYQMVLDEH